MDTLGSRLKTFFRAVDIKTQRELAERLEVAEITISSYMQGKSIPRTEVLCKLYELGCDTTWLLFSDGEMYARNKAGQLLKQKDTATTQLEEDKNIGTSDAVRFDAKRDGNVGAMLDIEEALRMPVLNISAKEIDVLESITKKLRSFHESYRFRL